MKKLLVLVLAFVMMLSLIACGNSNANEQTSGKNETVAGNEQGKPAETEGGNDAPVDSGEITLEALMKAPESPEGDFDCIDHGNGDVELVEYLGSSEIVVIPETWNGVKITEIASFVFSKDCPVKAIRISDSVKLIQGGAFGMNANLEIVVLGKGVEEIGEAAFQNCKNLKELVLNEGLIKLDEYSLSGLKSLTSVVIPATVTEIDKAAFYSAAEGFTIIGEAGSYAEEFAAAKGIAFKAK